MLNGIVLDPTLVPPESHRRATDPIERHISEIQCVINDEKVEELLLGLQAYAIERRTEKLDGGFSGRSVFQTMSVGYCRNLWIHGDNWR